MSLNVGVCVKKQQEGYMSAGCNPKGTLEEIAADFDAFLRSKFPDSAFNASVSFSESKQEYDFDVNLSYGWNDCDSSPMSLAIMEYVYSHFSDTYGIDMYVYHNP